MKKLFVSLCLLSCFITVSIHAQVRLSFNPELGATYEYRMESVQNVKQKVMGQEMPMETVTDGTYLMEIKSKTPQEIRVQFTFQGFIFSISSPMMNIKYNSKNPTESTSEMDKMFEKMFSTLIGKPFTVIFAPNGSVKSVSGMGSIIENMLGAVAADGQMATQMGAQMSQQFSDEAMKNMFHQSFNFYPYPDKAVKVGDSWNMEFTMPMDNMNFGVKTKNTLEKISANMATIKVAGDIDMDIEGSKLIGTQTGTMAVDITTGLPATSDIFQNMKGTIKMQGMEIQMEMITKAKTSVKKIN
jgi:hypothetical protein